MAAYPCCHCLVKYYILRQEPTAGDIESNRITLPNGWSLTPAGKTLRTWRLPLNIALSPSEKMAAITNNGQSDSDNPAS